ncbi:discoidin domain-containing protein [Dactylosporangium fulvum]|uniref:Discoidin domain-containing protein n=1 Tax=Dactylosporangium fulvum TaxID=53359 RepID=A0ABY5VW41_9ACTN|nr:discoidin domain-containing protein [Dactylosporangium fulvum]UWP80006.1 discoidin domain-containing protein [Dactylosporangium fulvum]
MTALLVPVSAAHAATGPDMYPRGIGADLGPDVVALGVRVRGGDDPAGLRTGTLDGRTYWQTQVAAGTSYFGVTPDAAYAASVAQASIVVVVTYYDAGSGQLTLRTASGDTKTVADLTGTNAWRLAAVGLDGAALTAGGAGELRLAGVNGGAPSDITVAQVRITKTGPQATLGPTPTGTGLSPRAGDNEAGLVTGTLAGRGYWRTNAAAPAPATNYLYMNVADSYAYNTTDIVMVSVDYFDAGNGTLFLHYDSPGEELADKFKPSQVVTYGDSQTWKTQDFVLDDAILTNRTNGSDFRLTHDGSPVELTVAAVRVTVVPRQLDVKAGLRDLVASANLALYAAREGTRDGQYPPGSKAALATAVAQAQAVLDDASPTEAQVAAAQRALYDAHQAFRASAVDTDLARHATLTASSSADGSSPAAANDGTATTAWTSGNGGAGEWLRADLGTARPVNEVLVQWGNAYSPDYTVEVSTNGTTYTVVGRSGGAGGNGSSRTRFPAATARYVRLNLTGYAPGLDGFDVAGFQIRDQRAVAPSPTLVKTKYPTIDVVVADFDATSYGADPTGKKDATAAIRAALYDCYDAGGGTVWLPEGTYRVTDTVEVPAFCTLRGDRRDPDQGRGAYGTVVSADLPAGDNGPVLFRIGGSAGVMGVTTYYPRQSATAPVPYNFTFEIPGSAWAGDENYMMSTVSDVTMLNSYRGIGISTMRDERGRPPGNGQTHESATVRNVKGTALLEGVEAYNGADVGTWENVELSNAYWAQAPAAYNPPRRSALDAWTRAHGTGFVLGDLEWDQFADLSAADYRVGIHIVKGLRAEFTGVFQRVKLLRTDTALQVDQFDARWGLSLAASRLEGSQAAVVNNGGGYVKLTDTKLVGAVKGTVYQLAGTVPTDDAEPAAAKPARKVLYDVSKAPYNASRGNGYLPAQDATAGIQRALDRAGRDGGGVVYLPAGWYRLDGRLIVPAGVELRGASSVPNRDEDGRSGGTVLLSYAGRNTANPDTDQAAITLRGERAGINGLRVFYPENNPAAPGGLVPYPYAIRGQGTGTYVVNIGLPNAWNAIDMARYRNDRFLVRKIKGTFVRHGVTVGKSDDGRIEGVLSNGNTFVRTGFHLPNWVLGKDLFPQVIDGWTRKYADLITVDGANRLTVADAFGYGLHNGLIVNSGDVRVFNLGTDNLGDDGYTVKVAGGKVTIVNLMRYNGTTSAGRARLYNVMVINIVEHNVAASVSPGGAGTVRLEGNDTRPGFYEPGSQVTASAKATPGYRFVNWTVGGTEVSTTREYTFTVTGDQALTANFAPVNTA